MIGLAGACQTAGPGPKDSGAKEPDRPGALKDMIGFPGR